MMNEKNVRKIKAWLVLNGITQARIAADMGLNRSTIATEKKIDDMQAQLNQALSSFQGQLDKIQAENAQLRQELEQSRAEPAVRNTG